SVRSCTVPIEADPTGRTVINGGDAVRNSDRLWRSLRGSELVRDLVRGLVDLLARFLERALALAARERNRSKSEQHRQQQFFVDILRLHSLTFVVDFFVRSTYGFTR